MHWCTKNGKKLDILPSQDQGGGSGVKYSLKVPLKGVRPGLHLKSIIVQKYFNFERFSREGNNVPNKLLGWIIDNLVV